MIEFNTFNIFDAIIAGFVTIGILIILITILRILLERDEKNV